MSTTIADIRSAVGYRATCPEGELGRVDPQTADLDIDALVIRKGVLMFTHHYLIGADHVRNVDHERRVVSLNGTREELLEHAHIPEFAESAGLTRDPRDQLVEDLGRDGSVSRPPAGVRDADPERVDSEEDEVDTEELDLRDVHDQHAPSPLEASADARADVRRRLDTNPMPLTTVWLQGPLS